MEYKFVYYFLDIFKKDWKILRVNSMVYCNMISKTIVRLDLIFEVYFYKYIVNFNLILYLILFSFLLKCIVWYVLKSVIFLENSMFY